MSLSADRAQLERPDRHAHKPQDLNLQLLEHATKVAILSSSCSAISNQVFRLPCRNMRASFTARSSPLETRTPFTKAFASSTFLNPETLHVIDLRKATFREPLMPAAHSELFVNSRSPSLALSKRPTRRKPPPRQPSGAQTRIDRLASLFVGCGGYQAPRLIQHQIDFLPQSGLDHRTLQFGRDGEGQATAGRASPRHSVGRGPLESDAPLASASNSRASTMHAPIPPFPTFRSLLRWWRKALNLSDGLPAAKALDQPMT